jgi:hypothetical protein
VAFIVFGAFGPGIDEHHTLGLGNFDMLLDERGITMSWKCQSGASLFTGADVVEHPAITAAAKMAISNATRFRFACIKRSSE